MPRLKFALSLCIALAVSAAAGEDVPPGVTASPAAVPPLSTAAPDTTLTDAAAAQLYPDDPIARAAFIALMEQDPTQKLRSDVQNAEKTANATPGATPDQIAAAFLADAHVAQWRQLVVDNLTATRKVLASGLKSSPPIVDPRDPYYKNTPLVAALVDGKSIQNTRALFAAVDEQKYGGGPCPQASSAMGQAQALAPGGSSTFTGGPCDQPPAANGPGSNPPSQGPAGAQTPPLTPTPPPVTDQNTTTGPPPAPGKDTGGGGGGGLGGFFSSLPTNQMLAGAGFGAAVGMLLGFGTPMGMIGGALIGGLIGAVFGSGVIGKLFGGGGTGGS